jgi:NAD(P)-dependent dehydrogenase (short-subunit alcohol dehydrogenase family)
MKIDGRGKSTSFVDHRGPSSLSCDPLYYTAFIVTGGCGALGGGVARELISRGGIAVVFDVLPEEKGQEIVSAYSKDRAFYFKTDISDVDIVQANCAAALEKIPKGSLFGAVHCAAISRSRKWSAKMADSCKDFLEISKTNIYGTFVRLDPLNPSLSESEPVHLLTQSLRVRYYRSSTLAWQTPSTRSTRQTTTTLFLPGSLKSVA